MYVFTVHPDGAAVWQHAQLPVPLEPRVYAITNADLFIPPPQQLRPCKGDVMKSCTRKYAVRHLWIIHARIACICAPCAASHETLRLLTNWWYVAVKDFNRGTILTPADGVEAAYHTSSRLLPSRSAWGRIRPDIVAVSIRSIIRDAC